MNASAAQSNRRRGKKETACALVDRHGRKVSWSQLKVDAAKGAKHFWAKRGGEPQRNAMDWLDLTS